MALRTLFTEHPASVGETYGEHLGMASTFGWRMLCGALACLIHGLLPFCFEKTGSRTIAQLHARMVVNRVRREAALPEKQDSHGRTMSRTVSP